MRRLVLPALLIAVTWLVAPAASAEWNPTSRGNGGVGVTVHQAGGPGAYSQAGGGSGITCKYTPEKLPTTGATPEMLTWEGQWYFYTCVGPPDLLMGNLFVPANRPAVAPATLARMAYRYLPLPPPGIRVNPPADRDQLVNLESWLWVEPATWGTRSATASVPNESATVTAVPVSVTWTMGDGGQVTCRGPGVPYDTRRPPTDQHTNCSYTYRRSSAGQPGERYPVTATTTWAITWTATGVVAASGTLPPLLRTSQTSLRVAEAEAIN